MTARRRPRVAAAFVLAGALSVCAVPALADDPAFTIADSAITESSGLAADPQLGVIWTVNDDKPGKVYALDNAGEVRGTLSYSAEITDVEAVARSGERLYVADIGDNAQKRKLITVYTFLNPQVADATMSYRAWDFVYPDGKARDAESLLVDGSGQLFIVTKAAKGEIYTFEGTPSSAGVNTLTRVASAPAYVTDGTFLADGRMALRTYVGLYVLGADYKTVASAGLPFQKQGESITTTLNGEALLVGSEGKNSTVLRVQIPSATGSVPKAGATPPASAATPEADPEAADAGGQDSQGTLLAVGAAALVAVLAALATWLIGRRRGRAAPGLRPGPSGTRDETPAAEPAQESEDLRHERTPGRETWAEPGSPPDEPRSTRWASGEDLDWLYEERQR